MVPGRCGSAQARARAASEETTRGGWAVKNGTSVACGQCGAGHQAGDNFCRRCGESLRVTRLPERAAPLVPDRVRSQVKLMAWRGVATMAVTALAQMMVRQAIRQVVPGTLRPPARRPGLPATRGGVAGNSEWGGYPPAEIQEAVVVRRIRFRR